MPRPARLDLPGAVHHVYNRGARREAFFLDEAGRAQFLAVLSGVPRRFGASIHGYALMPNHYHLILEVPRGNLGPVMQFVGGRFTARLNHLRGWDGPIFRGRYRNRLVAHEGYLRHLLAYLHLNPVRAGLAPDVDQAQWTSHGAYVGAARRPPWLTTHRLMDLHGGRDGYRAYVAGLQGGGLPAPAGFDPERLWDSKDSDAEPEWLGPPEAGPPPVEQVLGAVAAVTGLGVDELRARRRGRMGNPARWVTAWALVCQGGMSVADVGRELGVRGTGVSRMLRAADRARRADPEVAVWMDRLEHG